MGKANNAFAIDDLIGTADNISAYAQLLEAMDAPLGTSLSHYLTSLAGGQAVDTAAIWDALYAAMAPEDPAPVPPTDGAEAAEGLA